MHSWSWALESVKRRIKIQALGAQAELCRRKCVSLTSRLETGTLNDELKADVTRSLSEALGEIQVLRLAIGLLENQETDERSNSCSAGRTN